MSSTLIQGIGLLALGSYLISYQTKSNASLIIIQTIGNILFSIQYFFLGGISGCLTVMLAVTRNLLAVVGQNKDWIKWSGWVPLFSLAGIIITAYTWNGFISMLPLATIVVGTEGYLSDNARKIRAVNLFCCTPCWLMYNILTGSIGGVITETLGLCSILLSIYRYGWKYMGENRFDRRK